MFTTGSKWFFGLAAAAFVGALVYGGATNPSEVGLATFTGVLTMGYKGGVGDHVGYAVLMAIAGASLFLGTVAATTRDGSVEAGVAALELETVPEVEAPARGSYWPIIGAFGVGCIAIGAATDALLVMLGLVIVGAVVFEWAITAWSERATGDPEVNAAIRRRVMLPIEVPVMGALGVGVFVLAVSRMLLALPKEGVYALFVVVPILVLTGAFVLAAKPRINRSVVAGICVVGAIAVLAGGVVSAVVGPREIEPHHDEHEGAPAPAPGSPVAVPEAVR